MEGFTFNFGELFKYWHVIVEGIAGTAKLAAVSLTAGLLLGLVVGIVRLSRFAPLRWLCTAYVEIFRNTPGLIQLMWFFHVAPILTGWQQDAFTSSAIALTLNCGAFSSEIFRAGIVSIPASQWDAARSVGMTSFKAMRYIVLPQAIRRMVPALANRSIEVVKLTALASLLGYSELLYQAQLISAATYRPIETYSVIALFFVVMLTLLAVGARALERRLARSN